MIPKARNCKECSADISELSGKERKGRLCISCNRVYVTKKMAAWRKNNPEKSAEVNRIYTAKRTKHKDMPIEWKLERREKSKKYWQSRIDRYRELKRLSAKRYKKLHPDRHARLQRERHARARAHTPAWADKEAIRAIYRAAGDMTRNTGTSWTVDHIVPLKSSIVCGLHAHTNLQIISYSENSSKQNRYWPDMPTETPTGG